MSPLRDAAAKIADRSLSLILKENDCIGIELIKLISRHFNIN
jgi:hypothetical protein